MNKKLGMVIGILVGAAVLGLGIYQSDAAQADPKLSSTDIQKVVESQYPGEITKPELEKELNKAVYKVEIESNGKKYKLKLDGDTGEVLKLKEKEISNKVKITEENNDANDDKSKKKNKANDNAVDQSGKHNNSKNDAKAKSSKQDKSDNDKKRNSGKKAVIDESKAKEIALKEFPGIVADLELDEDDGRLIYEISIENGNEEADIDIDAYTGEILELSIDPDDD